MTPLVIALGVLPVLAQAFSNTIPVAVWNSHDSSVDALTKSPNSATALVDSAVSHPDICTHDAVLFIEHPDVHASDLRALPSSSAMLRSLKSSRSSTQFPYLDNSMTPLDIPAAAQSVSDHCGSRLLHISPGSGGVSFERGSKHVVYLNMPHMHSEHPHGRPGVMQEHDTLFSNELAMFESMFPKHLVIFAGTVSPSSHKRQSPDGSQPARPVIVDTPVESDPMAIPESDDLEYTPGPRPNVVVTSSGNVINYANNDSTVPKNAGILKKYQILTPGLILSLIIAFGFLIPAALIGFNALASIQSPVSVAPPKGFDAMAKKSQ